MKERSVTHHTFVIERNYPVKPERVFAAFADPAQKRRWFIEEEEGLKVESFTMDFRVGGSELVRCRFQEGSPFPGQVIINDTLYQDILPDRHIVLAYTMTLGKKRISVSLVTVEFLPTNGGTTLLFTEQAAFFDGADGPKMRQEGWQHILGKLATLLT